MRQDGVLRMIEHWSKMALLGLLSFLIQTETLANEPEATTKYSTPLEQDNH